MTPRIPRVNLLLVGPTGHVDAVLETVLRDAAAPVQIWGPGKPFTLPAAPAGGTMVVRDVDTLVQQDQRRLVEWIEQMDGRVRVISTASGPLIPSVEAGAFMLTLYYRLNTIYLDLTGSHLAAWDW